MAVMMLIALSATVYSAVQDNAAAQPQLEQQLNELGKTPTGPPREATVAVFDSREVQGILGKEVRSAIDESMGRIVNVIVDRTGQVRAAVKQIRRRPRSARCSRHLTIVLQARGFTEEEARWIAVNVAKLRRGD